MENVHTRTDRPESRTRVGRLLVALLAAVITFQLNATMLNPAVADMQARLGASAGEVGMQATIFFISAAVFGIFLPRWSDIVGRKPTLLAVLYATCAGTLLAIFAPSIEVLYVARGIQGICGVLVPMALIVMRDAVDQARFGTYMGIITGVNGGVSGVDALAGGALVDTVGFRGIFITTLAVGVIAAVLVWAWVDNSKPSAGATMDWLGVGLLCVAIGLLTIGVSVAGTIGWLSIGTLGPIAASLVGFAVFYFVERRQTEPLVPVGQMGDRGTWGLLLTTVLTLAGVFAAINFLAPSLAENAEAGFGMNASLTSLLFLTPYALIGWLVAPWSGRLAPRIGWRLLLRAGLACSVVALVLMFFGLTSPGVLVACAVLLGITYAGVGNIMLCGLGVVYSPAHNQGLLPGLNSTAFNVGASLGTGLLAPLISAGSPEGSSSTAGYEAALGVAVAVSILALAASFLLPARQGAAEKV